MAKLRREYFSVATDSGFLSQESETYRLHQIIDNALSLMSPTQRGRYERKFGEVTGEGAVAEVGKLLTSIGRSSESGDFQEIMGRGGVDLEQILGGMMTPEQFRTIVGTGTMSGTDAASILSQGALSLDKFQPNENITATLQELLGRGEITEEQMLQIQGRVQRSSKIDGRTWSP